MSAPASVHQTVPRRAQLIVEREYRPDPARCVAAVVKLLTYCPPAVTDTADHRRPLGPGARPTTHDDRTSACKHDGAVALEDGRHEPTDA